MKRLIVYISTLLLTFVLGIAAVWSLSVLKLQPAERLTPKPIPNIDESPAQESEITSISYPKARSIRSIDFYNFTYPGSTYGEYKDYYPQQTFTLLNGKWGTWRYGLTLLNVLYGDVTGDHLEEAILNFRQETDGSAGQSSVYIYTLENKKLKLLWAFQSGDRAWGGLRRVQAEKGRLVIELYGKETQIKGSSSNIGTETGGLCCPKFFTRTQYEWTDGRFEQSGEMEVLPNPEAKN